MNTTKRFAFSPRAILLTLLLAGCVQQNSTQNKPEQSSMSSHSSVSQQETATRTRPEFVSYGNEGYTLRYPEDWTIKEYNKGPNNDEDLGTTLLAQTSQTALDKAWFHISRDSPCRQLNDANATREAINGNDFSVIEWNDDAMGGLRVHGTTYRKTISTGRCITVITAIQYYEPGFGLDGRNAAAEERLSADKSMMQELLFRIVQSLEITQMPSADAYVHPPVISAVPSAPTKAFRSDWYGYSFQYPTNLSVAVASQDAMMVLSDDPAISFPLRALPNSLSKKNMQISILIQNNLSERYGSVDDWVAAYSNSLSSNSWGEKIVARDEISIGGVTGVAIVVQYQMRDSQELLSRKNIFVIHENKSYAITFDPLESVYADAFTTFLATFTFGNS